MQREGETVGSSPKLDCLAHSYLSHSTNRAFDIKCLASLQSFAGDGNAVLLGMLL